MSEDESALSAAEPSNQSALKLMRARWKKRLIQLRRPITIVAGIGAILGGLAGYVTVYRTVASPAPDVSTVATPGVAAQPLSILVLPLANQTGDPAKAYVADGLTTAIANDLSRISGAVVVPPLTALRLQDRKMTLQQMGSEAHVRFVLQGGVIASDDKVRINLQLLDTQSGAQLWTTALEGTLTDMFALQNKITQRVSSSLGPHMTIVAARDSERRAETPKVADLFVRASAEEFLPLSLARLQRVEVLCRSALAIEPENPRALVCVARMLWLQIDNFGFPSDRTEQHRIMKRAADLAQRALAAPPAPVSAYHVLSEYAFSQGDAEAARKALEHALELQPSGSSSLNNLGWLLARMGEPELAETYLLRSLEIPKYQSPDYTYLNLAETAMMKGRADDAIAWARKAIDANPNRADGWRALALTYGMKGDGTRAREAAAEMRRRLTSPIAPDYWMPPRSWTDTWPGKESQFKDYVENVARPAARLAGLSD